MAKYNSLTYLSAERCYMKLFRQEFMLHIACSVILIAKLDLICQKMLYEIVSPGVTLNFSWSVVLIAELDYSCFLFEC